MKVKRFKNLWLMGLIIMCSILIILYLIKLIFPEFVIEIAQVPSIIEFGLYIDSHWWAYYLFSFVVSFISGYLYCCACCRKNRLTSVDLVILLIEVIFLFIVQKFLPNYYLGINLICMLLMPTIMCKINRKDDIRYLYSTTICLTIHSLAQIISLAIRDIGLMIVYPNTVTTTLLLIDVYIWQFLLYNYFNYKEVKENGLS